MKDEFKDSRLKYVEMPGHFQGRASDISLTCKQHLRTCEALANRLAQERPSTPKEFEKLEYYKDFVIKTAQLNEQVLGLLDYTHNLLNAIAADTALLVEAKTKDTLRMQSETIEWLYEQNDALTKELHEYCRKNQKAA
jgi:hypothetical protein